MRHPLADVPTRTSSGQRSIACWACAWRAFVPRGNALAAAAKLRGKLWAHLLDCHPEEVAKLT